MAAADATFAGGLVRITRLRVGAPILLLIMLGMMVVPLPAVMLDVLFTFNISLGLVVLLSAVHARRPLDFAAFPTVLLLATLLRLALNVASTRVVLLNGHQGTGAAGNVIEAFGAFVIGGNYAVGLVVFAILVIINFVVVTKGAGRISEVTARFTLDAMPGKQMAIDADVNSGVITQDEARERRTEVSQEADFYGAMDGASKFVRGDAIAGILILLINIIGGVAIGVAQHDLSFEEAGKFYVLLTIGDGLVAQIPALVLSTAAAIMVTRVSAAHDMGEQIVGQLFGNPRSLAMTAAILITIGAIPGMPNAVFLTLGAAAGAGAYFIYQRREEVAQVQAVEPEPAPAPSLELSWDDVPPVDALGLEVGYRLIPLVDKAQGAPAMGRIKGVRKKQSQELGFLVAPVHIRDNLDLKPNTYRLILMGVPVGEAEVFPDRELAINPGQVFGQLRGTPGRDPVFDLEAVWIGPEDKGQAQTLGYTVVDAGTVIATHLSQVIQDHAHELLRHDDVQQLFDRLAETSPKLVENLVPKALPMATVVRVLQSLLRERISIRDFRTIAETLAEQAPTSQDPDTLTAATRIALGRFIVQEINGLTAEVPVITIDPSLDQLLHQSIQASGGGMLAMEPTLSERLHRSLAQAVQKQELAGEPAVLLVADDVRPQMARFATHTLPSLRVLGFSEVPGDRQIRIVANVGREPG